MEGCDCQHVATFYGGYCVMEMWRHHPVDLSYCCACFGSYILSFQDTPRKSIRHGFDYVINPRSLVPELPHERMIAVALDHFRSLTYR